ncbi:MAG: TRAP transporter small permease subunit [Pseudomonadota bacterium]
MFETIDRIATLLGRVLLKIAGLSVVIMMIAILVQVAASRMGITTVVETPRPWPVFGDAISLNSLSDLQWYLLALVALLPAGVILLRNGHVRVDFLYSNLGQRGKTVIDVLGHLIFALPFLAFIIPDAWELAAKAFTRGEASPNGGLTDRYLPRAAIPVGFALLLFAILFETWRNLCNWRRGDD